MQQYRLGRCQLIYRIESPRAPFAVFRLRHRRDFCLE